ncbi:hypothetical protein SLS62_005881 [Diatrype stigma]|uniref:Uncharacterized protein n=1 Tax=Diatrype stigma TaxID=117547 RepID=A0AAN9URP6_9PEZI
MEELRCMLTGFSEQQQHSTIYEDLTLRKTLSFSNPNTTTNSQPSIPQSPIAMASNRFAGHPSDGSRANAGRSGDARSRWSDEHHGLERTPPGYEYIARSVVMDGPSPPPPSQRGRDTPPIQAPGHYVREDSRPPSSLGKSVRKIVRQMSYRLRKKTPNDGDNTGPEPLFTRDNLFVPGTDQQMTFPTPGPAGTGAGQQEAARFDWDEHISYCATCETSYLIGKAGVKYACLHPHHLSTLNGQRSLVIAADTLLTYDTEGEVHTTSQYYLGPKSKYNRELLVGPFDNQAEAMAYALADCLDYVVNEVLPKRQDRVVRDITRTDNVFLKEIPWKCRVLIFAGLKGAPSYIDANAGPQMRELAAAIKRVADLGIDLKWFDINQANIPELGIGIAI